MKLTFRSVWTSDLSSLFGSTDVVWATSCLGWIATSGCIADEVASTEARHAQSPTKIDENCPSCSSFSPLPRLMGVTYSKSRKELACDVARVHGKAAGKEEDSDTSDHHRLRNLVDHLMCQDGKLEESLTRRAVSSTAESSNRSWQVPPVCKESRVPPGRTRQSERCPSCVFERLLSLGISTSRWFTASCCRDGSLAVIQPPWVQATAEESSSCGSVRPLACEQRTYAIKIAGKEKEGSCPIACATSPMLVGRDHSVRNDSIYQDRSPRWVGLRGPELVSMDQQALAPAKV